MIASAILKFHSIDISGGTVFGETKHIRDQDVLEIAINAVSILVCYELDARWEVLK